jgi:hypothetical protein
MFSVAVDMVLTAVMVVTPTLMFIGFYRGLLAMRDDDLINQLMMHENVSPPKNRTMAKAMGLEQYYEGTRERRPEPELAPGDVRCRHCGASNPDHVDYCATCLQRV